MLVFINLEAIAKIAPLIIFSCLVIYVSKLFGLYFRNRSIGFNTILILGVFINWFYVNDYLQIDYKITWGALLLSILLFTFISYRRYGEGHSIKDFLLKANGDYLKLFLTYITAVILLTVPLLFFLPKDTLVSGDNVSNDIIVHAVFAQGHEYTRELNIVKDDNSYPRGLHSTLFYINEIVQINPIYLVLIGQIILYAFIIFTGDEILFYSNLKNRRVRYIVMLFLTVPFLLISTLYANFAAHVVSIPFILLGMFSILNLNIRSKDLIKDLSLLGLILLSVFNIYSIFALNVLGFTVVIKIFLEIFLNRLHLRSYITSKKIFYDIKNKMPSIRFSTGVIALFVIGLIPALPLLRNTITYMRKSSGFLLSSNGNLSDFLSPWHITGIWAADLEYRVQPQVFTSYFLALFFAFQICFIYKANQTINRALRFTFIILLALSALGLVIINNRYAHFKYFTFLVPIFVFIFAYGFINYLDFLKNKFVRVILIITLLLGMVIIPSLSFIKFPIIKEGGKLEVMQQLRENYLDKGSTIYFGYDDWTTYFRTQNDDYMPMIGYLPTQYTGEDIRYFIVDPTYVEKDIDSFIESFFKKHPALGSKFKNVPEDCVVEYLERYTIYDLKCD